MKRLFILLGFVLLVSCTRTITTDRKFIVTEKIENKNLKDKCYYTIRSSRSDGQFAMYSQIEFVGEREEFQIGDTIYFTNNKR